MRGKLFEEQLRECLQDDIEIQSVNTGKIIRKGKLILYSIKEFYITIIIKTIKGETKQYHMPFPYDFELLDDKFVLNYKLELVCSESKELAEIVESLGESRSVFYDSIIHVNRNPA